jgi:tetratricopeptide (TPR) repeat protein
MKKLQISELLLNCPIVQLLKSNIKSPKLPILILLTVLQSYSLNIIAQESVTAPAVAITKNRETYYEASKQKILGNYDKAIELYKQALELDPADAASMYEIANIYTDLGKVTDAAVYAEQAATADPGNKWYKVLLIRLYQAQGNYTEAGKIIDELLITDPDNIEYYEDKALNHIYNNDYKNAVKSYDNLEQKLGVNEDISVQKEKIYIMMGKPEKAIEEIRKLSDAYPDEPRYLEMLAELYMTSGMYEEALQIYNKVLEIDPGNPYINISLSDYYRKKGDRAKSLEYLKAGFANPNLDIDSKVSILLAYYSVNEIYNDYKDEAFELATLMIQAHPNDPKAYSLYADFLVQDKRYEEGRDAFLKVISIDSTKYLVWEQLLFVESELNDYKAMAGHSTRALALFPDQPLLYLFAGASNFQMKDYEAAAKYFKNGANFVVGNDKMLAQFYSYLGDTYFQLKDHERSDEAYDKVLSIDPENVLVLNNYAYYLSLRGTGLEKAEQMAAKAVKIEPANSSYLDTYGWVLFKLGKYDEAKTWIEKAIEAGEESAVVLEHYGDVMWKLNDRKEAVRYWEKAQKAGEGSEFLEKKVSDKTYYE